MEALLSVSEVVVAKQRMDFFVQESVGVPMAEPMALFVEEGIDLTVWESLSPESMASQVEVTVLTV